VAGKKVNKYCVEISERGWLAGAMAAILQNHALVPATALTGFMYIIFITLQ
jgi:hypothetical protein